MKLIGFILIVIQVLLVIKAEGDEPDFSKMRVKVKSSKPFDLA